MGRRIRPPADDATTGVVDALLAALVGQDVMCSVADLKAAMGCNGTLRPLLRRAEADML